METRRITVERQCVQKGQRRNVNWNKYLNNLCNRYVTYRDMVDSNSEIEELFERQQPLSAMCLDPVVVDPYYCDYLNSVNKE